MGDQLCAYELQRQANIARNAKVLDSLGLGNNARKLPAPTPRGKSSKKTGKIKKVTFVPVEIRRSGRTNGKEVDYVGLTSFLDDEDAGRATSGSRRSGRTKRATPHFEFPTSDRPMRKRKVVTYVDAFDSDDSMEDASNNNDSDDDDGCICKIPHGLQSGKWIDCSQCQRWCHFECAGIDPATQEEELESYSYRCAKCVGDNSSSDDERPPVSRQARCTAAALCYHLRASQLSSLAVGSKHLPFLLAAARLSDFLFLCRILLKCIAHLSCLSFLVDMSSFLCLFAQFLQRLRSTPTPTSLRVFLRSHPFLFLLSLDFLSRVWTI